MTIVKLIFWISCILVVYPYFIYPLVLKALTLFVPPRRRPGDWTEKSVTIVISAYNEEGVIEEKIKNSLALDYPAALLEVIVVSDGSTDGTVDLARGFADRGVAVHHYEGRLGKTECLNRSVPRARGEIIVFTDANAVFDKTALKELVRRFSDENIGFVSGGTRYSTAGGETEPVGFYTALEQKIKEMESMVGSCVGADGAIFAVRKELFTPLRPADINDLVIPLRLVARGYSGVYAREAFCSEPTADSAKGEFNRQVRISSRTISAVLRNIGLLNPLSYGLFSFELLSHKLLRLLVPAFMLIALAANAALLFSGGIYVLAFAAQAALYLLAYLRHRGHGLGPVSRLVSVPHTFITVNLAVLKGWGLLLRGEKFVTWQPTR